MASVSGCGMMRGTPVPRFELLMKAHDQVARPPADHAITEYRFDAGAIREICGPLPYTTEEGVALTVAWLNGLSPLICRSRRSAEIGLR